VKHRPQKIGEALMFHEVGVLEQAEHEMTLAQKVGPECVEINLFEVYLTVEGARKLRRPGEIVLLPRSLDVEPLFDVGRGRHSGQ
jgi:hypothetical protein